MENQNIMRDRITKSIACVLFISVTVLPSLSIAMTASDAEKTTPSADLVLEAPSSLPVDEISPSVSHSKSSVKSLEHSSGCTTCRSAARVRHAKELLGRRYAKSGVKASEGEDIAEFVKVTTKKFLPKKFRAKSQELAEAIVKYSSDHNLDPVFVMAVVQNESSFNPTRRGGAGEIGLMQIKPSVAEWIAESNRIEYKGEKSLLDPVKNVELGIALLDKLRHQFDSKSRLYLSAYNIGAKKVRSLVEENKKPKVYVMAVMKRYLAMYSAFKVEADWKTRGEIAFHNTQTAIEAAPKL